jgi:DNA-binding transcriptional LysR family regulator
MPSEISELTVFHCVVKHASYARAADELTLSPSGVSRIISRMEERLGARLVQRTTRKLSLTEAGAAFHARTAQVLMDLADAESFVQETAVKPRGNLRVTAPVVFGQLYVTPLLGELLEKFPGVSIDLSLTDRMVDLIEEGVDLAIRIGQLTDSRLIARRLCQNHRVLVAAPDYLKQRKHLSHPSQLIDHECILFTGFTRPREWKLIGPDGPARVNVAGRVATNNVDTLTAAARQGLGITFGATLSAGPALLSGDLVRVLPAYEFEPTAIFAVYPSARQLSPKVRAVVDFLAENLRDPPSWDRRLAGKVPGFPAISSAPVASPHVNGRQRRRAGTGRGSPRPGA